MRFYVRLGLEGIPLHLWTESFAARVIDRTCSLHFAEEHSRRREAIDVFELLAWTADPFAIPLRVWLTVTYPDTGAAVPQVQVHWQRPVEPKRGMIYDVLVHLLSIKDMRRCGPDGQTLFYSFHTTMGVADADQEVAPVPVMLRQEAARGAEEQLHRVPLRNPCSAEY
jgi:hypothetical protein